MGLFDFLRKSTSNLPRIPDPTLIARMGEEEHPANKVENAQGGRMIEDWSEGKSKSIWSGRFSEDGRGILSQGQVGFQLWDTDTGRLTATIPRPNLKDKGAQLDGSDIGSDHQSFALY